MKIARILVLLITILGCSSTAENKLKFEYKYIGSPNYSPSKSSDKRCNKLVLAFTSNFKLDTINVKYNDIDTTGYINTDEVSGLAWILELGEISGSKDLELRINKFESVRFNINQKDQIFLVKKSDSTLQVNSLYYLPGFY
jgi:hypothetical protein